MRQRREVARRPDGTLGRDHRVEAVLEEARSRSTSAGRHPLWPRASVFARSRSIARTTSRGNGGPDARGVAHQQVLLEPRGVGRRDEPGGEGPEARRHAVDDLAGGDEPLDDVAGLLHPAAGIAVEDGGRAVTSDRLDVPDRQVGAGQDDRLGGPAGRPIGIGHARG